MADMMTFPNTVEEFMEQYKITDTEQIYTNGAELVPIFRMKQWFDHKPEITEEDVKEYCRKRCLCIVDSALLKKYAYAQPYTEEEIQKMQDLEQAQLDKAFELGRQDAVEVVRCKDCSHGEYCEDVLWCNITDEPMYEDDFCSFGERKEE